MCGEHPKPNSMFNGVQIGVSTYSYRSMPGFAENVLKYAVQSGINSVEAFVGPPLDSYQLMSAPAGQLAGRPAASGDVNEWNAWLLSTSLDGFRALRKLYNDAGVQIHIIKYRCIGDPCTSDAVIDRYFEVAKVLGAAGITRELSEDAARRLGPFADKHEIMVGFHNHMQVTPTTYDGDILSYGKYLGINFDIGHYVAATNESPIPFIEKYADRILSIHLKDRKVNNGPNMPFGEGDTPVALVLQHLKRNRLAFPADIELEYEIPAGSDAVREVARCAAFCKQALA
ncbi:MAG: sugar phosphate isomerase/epimerase [Lentisphaerae bacterium]|nr:sugar phosphate isomerase/epimerase [Lentisphaerota bacterium]